MFVDITSLSRTTLTSVKNRMISSENTQAHTERTIIETFDVEFAHLQARSRRLIETTPDEILYEDPRAAGFAGASNSVGECILRSAGAVEQTFGGITSNLWDDPFEWTLPETLSTRARVIEYLGEVEETRHRAFASFADDGDLLKRIAAPSGDLLPLVTLLLDTLVRALGYQGRAMALRETLSVTRPGGFIIERHA
jgi:hypothetical protein